MMMAMFHYIALLTSGASWVTESFLQSQIDARTLSAYTATSLVATSRATERSTTPRSTGRPAFGPRGGV